jgi:hypothetical protein
VRRMASRASPWQALLASIAFACGLCVANQPAQACLLHGNVTHELDAQAQATDSTPPGEPTLALETIKRGKGAEGCGTAVSSCDDLGWIAVRASATDDQTPAASLGYRVELASGSLPSGLTLPADAVRGDEGGLLSFGWIDGNSDDQESLSFSLAVRAVDLAGNVGPPAYVPIDDPGSGCSMLARRPFASGWSTTVVILLAAYLLRRCRRYRAID